MPVRYVERLNAFYQSQGFPPYHWSVFPDAPWTSLAKPLRRCRVSLLASGGVSCKWQPPFAPDSRNNLTVLPIPRDTAADAFVINDAFYDHSDADVDVNCVFPIERLRELAADGLIGEVAPTLYSGFMGRIYVRTALMEQAAPALAESLKREDVDALVLVAA